MSDLKERLKTRAWSIGPGDLCADLLIAAGTIDELEEQNKELLESVEALVDFIALIGSEGDPMQAELITNARAAIAKAKGEE